MTKRKQNLPVPLEFSGESTGQTVSAGYNGDKGGAAMTVTIDQTRCIGCGMCAYAAPGVFRIVQRASVVLRQPQAGETGRVFDAANGCPVNAIRVRRD